MDPFKEITSALLDELLEKAAASDRLRAHWTMHEELSDPFHRFCVAAQPGTVVKTHRHPGKWELMILLRGRITVQLFDASGKNVRTVLLAMDGKGDSAVQLPEELFHTFTAEEPSVFLEVKPGPYTPPEELN